ncbi:hypothetical protein FA13DRAFT_1796253 [Coprinellus micaceus]|uniref:F-box domain-containing protein n=1 Tax=Coprinellus micaceus TaxID=71717 RepID=A0A4Y7SVB4_COPMI|nr:hypothetical protein FA13DRAFT_1796253 [Coprinellus micaceus]
MTSTVEPTFPLEIQHHIVDMLEDCPEALRHISATSKALLPRTRQQIFRTIKIQSYKCIVDLASLLGSRHCTIPTEADTLELDFEFPRPGRKLGYDTDMIFGTIMDTFEHFTFSFRSILLNMPWVYSKNLDWSNLHQCTSLRRFVIAGSHVWLDDITRLLYYTERLEVLIIDASFKSDSSPSMFTNIRNRNPPCRVPPTLKELALSAEALPFLRWMCHVEPAVSFNVLRIKIDNIGSHFPNFLWLPTFVEKFGGQLVYLYFWFEPGPRFREHETHQVLGETLQCAPKLRQFKCLLPNPIYEDEIAEFLEFIPPYMRPSMVLELVCGRDIGVDETPFWEALSLQACMAASEDGPDAIRVVVTGLELDL